ncbi:MAG: hypothetical protein ACRC3B_02145 [Bacteroidia bacterium]
MMKKLFYLLLLLLPGYASAQFITGGISPGLSIARYKNVPAAERALYPSPYYPGICLEANYIVQGFPFPISSYNSLGIGFYTSDSDTAALQDGLGTKIVRRVNTRDIRFRFGYELPMRNEFVTVWLGWSVGWRGGNSKVISAYNNTGPADPASYSSFSGRQGGVSMGILAGGMYEFEHFFVFGRYEFVVSPSERLFGTNSWHQLNAGVFIPVFRFI